MTQKPGKLFLHVMTWPEDEKLVVPVKNGVTKAYLLTDAGSSIKSAAGDAGVTLSLPAQMPDKGATVIVLELDGAPKVIEPPKSGG